MNCRRSPLAFISTILLLKSGQKGRKRRQNIFLWLVSLCLSLPAPLQLVGTTRTSVEVQAAQSNISKVDRSKEQETQSSQELKQQQETLSRQQIAEGKSDSSSIKLNLDKVDSSPVKIDTGKFDVDKIDAGKSNKSLDKLDSSPVKIDTDKSNKSLDKVDSSPVKIDADKSNKSLDKVDVDKIDTGKSNKSLDKVDSSPVKIDTGKFDVDKIDTDKSNKSLDKVDSSPVKIDTGKSNKSLDKVDSSPVKLDTGKSNKSSDKVDSSPVKIDTGKSNKSLDKVDSSPVKIDAGKSIKSPDKVDSSPVKIDAGKSIKSPDKFDVDKIDAGKSDKSSDKVDAGKSDRSPGKSNKSSETLKPPISDESFDTLRDDFKKIIKNTPPPTTKEIFGEPEEELEIQKGDKQKQRESEASKSKEPGESLKGKVPGQKPDRTEQPKREAEVEVEQKQQTSKDEEKKEAQTGKQPQAETREREKQEPRQEAQTGKQPQEPEARKGNKQEQRQPETSESIELEETPKGKKPEQRRETQIEQPKQAPQTGKLGNQNRQDLETDEGDRYFAKGEYLKALKYYEQGLTTARKVSDQKREAETLNKMAAAHRRLGQHAKAEEFTMQALLVSSQVFFSKSFFEENEKFIEEIEKKLKEESEKYETSTNYYDSFDDVGETYRNLGRPDLSLVEDQKTLARAKGTADRLLEGKARNNIGEDYRALEQYSQALESQQQALAIARDFHNPRLEGKVLNNIGTVHQDQDQYVQALEFYQQALKIVKQIDDPALEGTILNNIGTVHQVQDQYVPALASYQQALKIAKKTTDPALKGKVLSNMGYTLSQTGKLAEAEKNLYESIEVLESLRPGLTDALKVSLIDKQANPYRFLQQTLIAQNKTDAALEIAEQSRARAFVELLASRLSPAEVFKGLKEGLLSPVKGQDLNLSPAVRSPSIQQIQKIAREQNAALVEYSIAYEPFKVGGKENWRESKLYIWVVQPTGAVVFRQISLLDTPLADLAPRTYLDASTALVRGIREVIGLGDRPITANSSAPTNSTTSPAQNQRTTPKLHQAHQLLIQPIADLLPKDSNSHVVFVPQDTLFLVPFGALQDSKGQYLIEKHTILMAPSIQVLDLTRQQRQRAKGQEVLVAGNPTMPKKELSPLPEAEQEAINIARFFNTQAMIGDQATETAIAQRMPSARLIHLATHGLLQGLEGEAPGAVALAPSAQADGLLTSSEILDLQLQAELVVLSACDTGRGQITGDGVIGLSRSLISAGAPSVVVSLWKVPDAPTAFLMRKFYGNLRQTPNKAQALRQAMLTTMKQYPSPQNWAAFTLIGEAR